MGEPAIRVDEVFEDPIAIRSLVERGGPYRPMASYLPQHATSRGRGIMPWFRGTWAAHGTTLVDGADVILKNRHFAEAASRLFGGVEVTPNAVVVNVNAPMPAGAVHVDIPSFRGADRDRYPIQLLQAMGTSGLFEAWRIVEAGAVVWFYDGPGGAYDYWPEGLNGPMRSEFPPFINRALVADNDRMYHRIGWIGDPAPTVPAINTNSEIAHMVGTGWVIRDGGRVSTTYPDAQVRISILWKARIELREVEKVGELTPDRIQDIFAKDLEARGIRVSKPPTPLSDQTWLDAVHATYYPVIDLKS
jgi:hypothetical protein